MDIDVPRCEVLRAFSWESAGGGDSLAKIRGNLPIPKHARFHWRRRWRGSNVAVFRGSCGELPSVRSHDAGAGGQSLQGLAEARVAGAAEALLRVARTREPPVPTEEAKSKAADRACCFAKAPSEAEGEAEGSVRAGTTCDCRRFELPLAASLRRPDNRALCRRGLRREASCGPSRCGTEPFRRRAAARGACRPWDEYGR